MNMSKGFCVITKLVSTVSFEAQIKNCQSYMH